MARLFETARIVFPKVSNFAAEHPDRARALEMQLDGEDIASIGHRVVVPWRRPKNTCPNAKRSSRPSLNTVRRCFSREDTMMNEKISKEDQDWLDVLSGKSPEGIDPLVLAQASAVRNALTSRREAIESDANNIGDSGLNEIRARLQREGLLDSTEGSQQEKWLVAPSN